MKIIEHKSQITPKEMGIYEDEGRLENLKRFIRVSNCNWVGRSICENMPETTKEEIVYVENTDIFSADIGMILHTKVYVMNEEEAHELHEFLFKKLDVDDYKKVREILKI